MSPCERSIGLKVKGQRTTNWLKYSHMLFWWPSEHVVIVVGTFSYYEAVGVDKDYMDSKVGNGQKLQRRKV